MMMYEERKRQDTEYIATVLWSIGRSMVGAEYPIPAYSEYIDPKPQDTRSKETIVNSLISKLGGEVNVSGSDGVIQSSGENGSG